MPFWQHIRRRFQRLCCNLNLFKFVFLSYLIIQCLSVAKKINNAASLLAWKNFEAQHF